jgi:hypothetical protein
VGSKNPERCAPWLTDTTRLAELAERFEQWRIEVYCAGCIRSNRLEPRKLIELLGPAATVGDLRPRLKCIRCGGRSEDAPRLRAVLRRRKER